jgi:hypothetical protein
MPLPRHQAVSMPARGYFLKLFANARIARYLNQRYPDIVRELQTTFEGSSLES